MALIAAFGLAEYPGYERPSEFLFVLSLDCVCVALGEYCAKHTSETCVCACAN